MQDQGLCGAAKCPSLVIITRGRSPRLLLSGAAISCRHLLGVLALQPLGVLHFLGRRVHCLCSTIDCALRDVLRLRPVGAVRPDARSARFMIAAALISFANFFSKSRASTASWSLFRCRRRMFCEMT